MIFGFLKLKSNFRELLRFIILLNKYVLLDIFFDTDVRLAKKFLLRGVPTTLIIDKDGEEIARIVGSIDFQDHRFKSWLQNFD